MDNLYIVAGLGNPGRKYEETRHNAGFNTVDLLASKHGIRVDRLKFKALWGEGDMGGRRVLLVKPQTFMNLSGESVRDIVEWYRLPPERLIVVYDDVDLPAGRIRVRPGGSAGTHNGMKNIVYLLGEDRFPRVRIGIGRPPEGWEMADFVLSRYRQEEKVAMASALQKAADAVTAIVTEGIAPAMNRFNAGERKENAQE